MQNTGRTLRHFLSSTLAAAALAGCCFSPTAAPTPPAMPTGPSGPTAPGCPALSASILGTWTREGFVEEYRADGAYIINGQQGTITWSGPGHAVLDVPSGGFHADYDLALADANTLVAADANGVGSVYTRTSAAPAIPAECFDLRSAWVGTWTPNRGGSPERYDATGTYAAPGTGQWTFTAPGRLHLVNDTGPVSDYVVGLSSATTGVSVSVPPLAPAGVAYTRAP